MKQKVTAIIVAAGSSRRMADVCKDKLLLKLDGIPVLARTLIQYQTAESIDEIVVVTKKDLFPIIEQICKEYHIGKFTAMCEGGETRQHSVQNGLALCADSEYIAIGDGARPFTKPRHIDKVTIAAKEHGGALLCVAAKDTVKRVSPDGFVDHTPPRSELLQAQTPQTFRKALFEELMERSIRENKAVTDDASVFELYDAPVFTVIGDYDNIKITTEEDIAIANAIVGKEQK